MENDFSDILVNKNSSDPQLIESDDSSEKVSLHDIINTKDNKYNAQDIFQFDSNLFKRDKLNVKYRYVTVKKLESLFQ